MSRTGRDRLVLAVDLGSGGPKVGYVTLAGEPVWTWYERGDAVGGAETQDAGAWWRTIVSAARLGTAEGHVDGADVVGVAVTGQWASTVPVDAAGVPVAECLMWSDTRGAAYSRERFGGPVSGYAPTVLATWLRRSGGVPSPGGADPVAHLLHLQHDRPEVLEQARWCLEPVDYLTMRFTGRATATAMSMTAAWLTDNRDLDTLAYDPVLLRIAGVDPARLPPLVRGGSVVGTVLPDVAAEIGISADAQVVTGAPDLHNAVIASGCVDLHQTHLSLGTSAWISCPVPSKKTDVFRQLAAVPGIGDGHYVLADNQDNAGRCLEWFRASFAPDLEYDDLAALAASAPPGAGGVFFTPWLSGERSPVDARWARGGFHNLSLAADRAALARAVMEGVALNLRWLLEAAEHFTGRRMDPIRLVGGGATMDVWCQILADTLDRTLERVEQPWMGGLRGGGLTVGLALGEIARDEVHGLVPVERVFTPDPGLRSTYDAMSVEFRKLFKGQRGMFRRLNTDETAP
ncbi:FGGY-family carbohydrate kinase [Nocardioides sp.]|uniref:xylulokinase n=1 Tax=Nocardioides sp. TaxID=35761 RepID=UPI0035298FC0